MLSGKDGKVLVDAAAVADVVRWTLRTAARCVAYASNATGEHVRRLPGTQTAAGSVAFQLHAGSAPPATGQAAVLRLHLDAARYYEVPALFEAVELEVDVDTGAPIGGTAQFVSDGPWTPPTFG